MDMIRLGGTYEGRVIQWLGTLSRMNKLGVCVYYPGIGLVYDVIKGGEWAAS